MSRQCRARMIDGTPVTFEMIDHGPVFLLGEDGCDGFTDDSVFAARWQCVQKLLLTEFIGYGLHVRSYTPLDYSPETRSVRDKFAMRRVGVDTPSAEYLDSYIEHSFDRRLFSDLRPHWIPLFPRPMAEIRGEPGGITYCMNLAESAEPTSTMIHNGCSALRDAVDRCAYLKHGHLWFSDPEDVVRDIWKRMEKGRLK